MKRTSKSGSRQRDGRKQSVLGRTPPDHVRRQLREEVGFICPWENCASPFLTWHHFDPPWREKKHHKPAGMIALCATHAGLADSNNYSCDFFRATKAARLGNENNLTTVWPWFPDKVTFVVGNNFLFTDHTTTQKNIVLVGDAQRLGIQRRSVNGRSAILFDLHLQDANGEPIVRMEQNELVAWRKRLSDFSFTARGKEFSISHVDSGTHLSLRFERLSQEAFLEKVPVEQERSGSIRANLAALSDSDGLFPVVSVEGRLYGPQGDLIITPEYLHLDRVGHPIEDPIKLQELFLAPNGALNFKFGSERKGYLKLG